MVRRENNNLWRHNKTMNAFVAAHISNFFLCSRNLCLSSHNMCEALLNESLHRQKERPTLICMTLWLTVLSGEFAHSLAWSKESLGQCARRFSEQRPYLTDEVLSLWPDMITDRCKALSLHLPHATTPNTLQQYWWRVCWLASQCSLGSAAKRIGTLAADAGQVGLHLDLEPLGVSL